MQRDEIKNKLESIFNDIFSNVDMQLSDNTTAEEIEGWDSLTHLQLIMNIEQTFNMKFTTAQIRDTKDVGSLLDIIQEKIR